MFKGCKKFEIQFADRLLIVEVGNISSLSNGSCIVRYGDTTIMANVVASSRPKHGIDFFPLSVDFEGRLYSVGKIPGSFFKREGRPTESSILTSRLIDRPIRPLFPQDMRNEVMVTITVLSVDQDNSPEIAGLIGVSVALSISDIPWNGPVAGVGLGYVNGKIVINPIQEQREISKMMTIVAGTGQKIVMLEASAKEISEVVMLEAIVQGHIEIKKIITFINGIASEVGKEKFKIASIYGEITEEMESCKKTITEYAETGLSLALDEPDKLRRDRAVALVLDQIREKFSEYYNLYPLYIDDCLYKMQKKIIRNWIVEKNKRVDGRAYDEIRHLEAQVGMLPRVHGCGMFTRGYTKVLTIATLGLAKEAQLLDGLDTDESKTYIHHYNFPGYSVGESKPSRAPGRREIGHGALAERALIPVIPSLEEFPYTIRLVSEVLSSNGSTSQGAVCGSTLALMDAGVPIKAPVAGISCGLVCYEGGHVTMIDIQGAEDFFGDMDFKVAGTHKGITAIQVDIKNDGLSYDIIKEAFEKTKKARIYILDEIILKTIDKPRAQLSKFVPKIQAMKIDTSKIRDVIGVGGKIVQKIVSDFNVTVDIREDGTIFVASTEIENTKNAIAYISRLVQDVEIGQIYNGRVVKIMPFGAFVEILPGKEGLVHISKLSNKRVEKIEDVLKQDDEVFVKLIGIDEQGKLILSKKDAFHIENK